MSEGLMHIKVFDMRYAYIHTNGAHDRVYVFAAVRLKCNI